MKDFINQLQAEIHFDGDAAAVSAQFEPIQYLADKNAYTVLTTLDVGMLPSGQYDIRTVLSFKSKIEDGYDQYGPGTENPTFEGFCAVVIE